MGYITLKEIKDSLDLEIINKASDFDDVKIYSTEISRPGLQLVGYFKKICSRKITDNG
jgi:HPr kinase/phosphorylase